MILNTSHRWQCTSYPFTYIFLYFIPDIFSAANFETCRTLIVILKISDFYTFTQLSEKTLTHLRSGDDGEFVMPPPLTLTLVKSLRATKLSTFDYPRS